MKQQLPLFLPVIQTLMVKSCLLHLGQDHTKHKAAASTVIQHPTVYSTQTALQTASLLA